MRNHKLKALSMALLLLSGCSNTGSNGGSGTTLANEEATTLENPVRLDQLGVLPASNSSAASYLLQLTNYSKDKYTLDSVRIIDLDTGKDSTLVSVASQACSTVSANGSCSIQLTPHTSQSADVKLEVNLKDKLGASTKLVQLIRVSGELSSNNGGIVMLNDVDRIVTEDGNYSLSIPVVLGESYDDIKASNGSLICNTTGYQKGSSCTYQVSGKVSGDSAVVSTRLEGIKAGKTATVQEANTKVEVAKGAHLLLSHGTRINDPATSGEITVFNNGNTAATDVAASVEATSGLKIDAAEASACGTTLEASDTCKVKVSVNSTTNGQGSVKVAYKDNGENHTAQTNVRYKVANATAGVTFTEQSNNLPNAIIGGKTREAVINVKNSGNRRLEGVSYYLAPAGSSGLSVVKGAENGCNLAGATLAANESCNLSVKYAPSAAFDGSKSINLVINSKYTDQNEQSHSLISAHGLNYSAVEVNSGNLELTKIKGNDILSIINDNISIESATWLLRNTLAADEGLSASAVKVALNPATTIEGLTIVPANTTTCPQDTASIGGNSSCEYIVSYGPTLIEKNETNVNIKADYKLGGKSLSNAADFKVKSSATPQPKIKVEVAISGTPVTGDGNGATTPWSFTAYNDKTIGLKYTFTNIGNLEAERFNIDTGNLPKGAVVTDTTCSTGTDTSPFAAAGGNCIVNVNIPDPELFNVPNLTNNSLNGASLKLDLPYSYNYKGKLYRGQGDTKYVKFNRLWANVQHTIQATSSTESAFVFGIQSKISGLDNGAKSYPITVTPTLAHPIAGVTLTPCTITDASKDSCINTISLPQNIFIGGSELLVTFETSANNMDNQNRIISTYPVRLLKLELKEDLVSPLKMGDNQNVVPFGIFANKIINTTGKKYPFELTLSAEDSVSNLGFSDIKLSNSSVLASGTKVTLVNNSCKQENSPPADDTCKVEGMLEFELAADLKWKSYENKSMVLVLEARYNNQVFHSTPVKLNLDSILINARQVNLSTKGYEQITLRGVDHVRGVDHGRYFFSIPNGVNTGVIKSPMVRQGWLYSGINTIALHAVNTANGAAPVDLTLFLSKTFYANKDFILTLNSATSIQTLNPVAQIRISADAYALGTTGVYDYDQKELLAPEEYQQFNAKLAPGIYQGGFYIYGQNYDHPTPDHQVLEYIQLNYERN